MEHTPLIHVVQKLLMNDVDGEVEVDDSIGTDGLRALLMSSSRYCD
jgi:hypothetical protein